MTDSNYSCVDLYLLSKLWFLPLAQLRLALQHTLLLRATDSRGPKIARSLGLFVLRRPPERAAPVHLFTMSCAVRLHVCSCIPIRLPPETSLSLPCKVTLEAKPRHRGMFA